LCVTAKCDKATEDTTINLIMLSITLAMRASCRDEARARSRGREETEQRQRQTEVDPEAKAQRQSQKTEQRQRQTEVDPRQSTEAQAGAGAQACWRREERRDEKNNKGGRKDGESPKRLELVAHPERTVKKTGRTEGRGSDPSSSPIPRETHASELLPPSSF